LPTPVSALLHAATLVTAGIYLLLRCSPILEYSPNALLWITLIGSTTAFVAGTSGLVQNDLKRIIAMSTISQLGYMVTAIGLSQYNVALYHTINHSFFKALLFLCAGAVIHSFRDQQDIRRMGGLLKFLPFVYSAMIVGTLSLLALPFLSGFYSKDLIIELAYGQYSFSGMYAFILGSVTAGITAFYSFRLISLVFLSTANGNKQSYLHSHESNLAVIIPLIILALFSIFFGYVCSDMFVGIGSDFLGNSIFIHPNNIVLVEAEYSLSTGIKLLPSIFTVIGVSSALILYHYPNIIISKKQALSLENNPKEATLLTSNYEIKEIISSLIENPMFNGISKKIYNLLNSKYYFDVLYNNYLIGKGFKIGYAISKELDRGVIELIGPKGLSNSIIKFGKSISSLDTGIITTYALYITIGLLFFLFIIFSSILFDGNVNEMTKLSIILIFAMFITPLSLNSK
jgi:NADH-ubiquinone oxidoreductase chain 5